MKILPITVRFILCTIAFTAPGNLCAGNDTTYNRFLGDWKVLGPIKYSPSDPPEPDTLMVAVNAPWSGDSLAVFGNKIRIHDNWDRAVNINSLVDRINARHSLAVCRTRITSDQEQQLMLSISADERAVFYLNGEAILDYTGTGTVIADATSVPVALKSGRNQLDVISYNTDGEWGITAKLLPMTSSRIFHLHYHLDPLPPGLGTLPQAAVTFIDKNGATIAEEWVSTWRSEVGRGTYVIHANPKTSPQLIKIDVAVPYLNRNDIRVFKPDEVHGTIVGRPGTAAIYGHVLDYHTSQPIAGAYVTLVGNDEKTTQTDSSGRFLLTDTDPAYSILKLEAPHYESRMFDYYVGNKVGNTITLRPRN